MEALTEDSETVGSIGRLAGQSVQDTTPAKSFSACEELLSGRYLSFCPSIRLHSEPSSHTSVLRKRGIKHVWNVVLVMGDRDRNVGRLDRMLRVPLGVALTLAATWVFLTYPSGTGIIAVLSLVVSAAVLIISAMTGTCGIYGVFGINTCTEEDCIELDSKEAWVAE